MSQEDLQRFLIENLVRSAGISLFGVADLIPIRDSFHPSLREATANFSRGISLGFRLSDAIIDQIQDRPTLLYKHHYKTVNYGLDQMALRVMAQIQAQGYQALPIPASQTIDWENQLGHLSHKAVARQAGLGWIGRSGLLVNSIHGARVRYVSILTALPLRADQPVLGDCGECVRCIEVCPAKAISMDGYEREKCLGKLKEFAKERGIGVYICGVCVKACPIRI